MSLLAALFLLAQANAPRDLPRPPQRAEPDAPVDMPRPPPAHDVDASPTAFACTFTTALRGNTCTYEAEAHAAPDTKSNVKLAADQASKVCAAEAETAAQREACVKLTAKAAQERCTGDGRGLADEEGRLTRAAEPCAIALRQVIFRTTGRSVESAPPEPAQKPRPTPTPKKTNVPEKI